MNDPSLIPQWWGPAKYTTTVDVMEPRQGGRWRYVQSDGGEEFAFSGVYHSLSPELTISTFEWEGMPGHVLLSTITLEDARDTTLMRAQSLFQTIEDRDGMMATGMETGAIELYNRLNQVVINQKEKTK
jgi:uncharacterized protein YndB with AHSA1/START domain